MTLHIRRWLTAAVATTAVLGTAGPAALADTPAPVPVPAGNAGAAFTVEDGSYPGAKDLLQATGITVTRGDGGIVYTPCDSPHQIVVWARSVTLPVNRACFAAPGASGYLAVTVPDAFRIEASGRTLHANLTTNGSSQSVDVAADTSVTVGEAASSGSHSVLLELNVTGSTAQPPAAPAPDPVTAATVRIAVGDLGHGGRSCTGTLVDPVWVVTAKSCFADNPATSLDVAAGAPKTATTVTVGRTDLTAGGGHTVNVAELVPRTDRDLVLARLASPVFDVAPMAVSVAAPTAGEELTTAGWGRTRGDWVPARLHTATVTAGTADATGLDTAAKTPADGTVCQGDGGGPVWRTENGQPALAAVTSRAWQGGCLGTDPAETRTGAYRTRTDDLASWVSTTAASSGVLIKPGTKLTAGQSITGPGLKLTMRADGDLVLTHRQADGGVLWDTATGGNNGAWAYLQPDGNFVVYKADGNPAAGTGGLWATGTYFNNGAYLKLQNDGNFVLYKGDGGEGAGGALWSTSTFRGDATVTGNTRMGAGQWREGPASVLEVQKDGNVVLYRRSDGAALWASGSANNPGAWAFMQTDGNFVVYRADGNPAAGTGGLWASGTYMFGGSHLKLQDDGKLAMFKSADETLANTVWTNATLRPITQLNPGYRLNAKTTWLEMQWDGNLVLHRNSDGAALWQSNTSGWGNFLKIQQDGNAVVYKLDGTTALWNSGTFWSGGSYLKLQDDGNLVVYKADGGEGIGGAIWSSNTFAS